MVEIFLVYSLVFIFGVCIGSFINVIIDRLPEGKFFSKKRSYCDACKKTLVWYDLIPVVSFLLLKGKCRYCQSQIPLRSLIVELITGIGFCTTIALYNGPLLGLLSLLILFSIFCAIFFIDIKYLLIPDSLLVSAILPAIILHGIVGTPWYIPLLSSLGAFLFFFILFMVTKGRGMGFGDVKFAGVLGLLLGFPTTIVALYCAFVTGAVISLLLLVMKKKKLRGAIIPFGPFMIIGLGIGVLWGDTLLQFFF